MKLSFAKIDGDCEVKILFADGNESPFSYVDMVKGLFDGDKLEETAIFTTDFSDREKDSVENLIKEINSCVDSHEKGLQFDSQSDDLETSEINFDFGEYAE